MTERSIASTAALREPAAPGLGLSIVKARGCNARRRDRHPERAGSRSTFRMSCGRARAADGADATDGRRDVPGCADRRTNPASRNRARGWFPPRSGRAPNRGIGRSAHGLRIPTLRTQRLDLLPPRRHCPRRTVPELYTDATRRRRWGPLSTVGSWTRLASDLGFLHLQGFGVWCCAPRRDELVGRLRASGRARAGGARSPGWMMPRYRSRGFAQERIPGVVAHAYDVSLGPVETYGGTNDQARALSQRAWDGVQIERSCADGPTRDLFALRADGTAA